MGFCSYEVSQPCTLGWCANVRKFSAHFHIGDSVSVTWANCNCFCNISGFLLLFPEFSDGFLYLYVPGFSSSSNVSFLLQLAAPFPMAMKAGSNKLDQRKINHWAYLHRASPLGTESPFGFFFYFWILF